MGLFYKKEMKISLPTPRVSFLSPVFSFLPFTKTLERVFQSFSSSNLEKIQKICSKIFIQGQKNEDWGLQKNHGGFGKRNFLIALI
jgi:hypothetical protein